MHPNIDSLGLLILKITQIIPSDIQQITNHKSYSYTGVIIWNALAKIIKSLKNLRIVK